MLNNKHFKNSYIMTTTTNNSEVKIIRKNVNVNVNDGLKYINIYEVRGVKPDGDTFTIDRYLNEKDAENQVEFCYEHYKNLYTCFFIREQFVWC